MMVGGALGACLSHNAVSGSLADCGLRESWRVQQLRCGWWRVEISIEEVDVDIFN